MSYTRLGASDNVCSVAGVSLIFTTTKTSKTTRRWGQKKARHGTARHVVALLPAQSLTAPNACRVCTNATMESRATRRDAAVDKCSQPLRPQLGRHRGPAGRPVDAQDRRERGRNAFRANCNSPRYCYLFSRALSHHSGVDRSAAAAVNTCRQSDDEWNQYGHRDLNWAQLVRDVCSVAAT